MTKQRCGGPASDVQVPINSEGCLLGAKRRPPPAAAGEGKGERELVDRGP